MTTLTPSRPVSGDRPLYVTPPRRGILGLGAGSDSTVPIQSSLVPSPAYATNYKKHSLYGFEDRVVIDPGSRIWKIGFSGEPEPRKVFWPVSESNHDAEEDEVWDMDLKRMAEKLASRDSHLPLQIEQATEEMEEDAMKDETEIKKLIHARLMRALKDVFIRHLLAESFKRKVIVLENAMLPKPIKEMITDILIRDLEVPSVTFLSIHMTATLAVGRTTALVVDVGHLETSVLPVIASRLIQPCLSVTPNAGRSFLARLRILILRYGQYKPPSAIAKPKGSSSRARAHDDVDSTLEEGFGNVPASILTRDVLEDIRIRGCFVAPPITDNSIQLGQEDDPMRGRSRSNHADVLTDVDLALTEGLYRKYGKTAICPDATFRCPHHEGHIGQSLGTLSIPGWIRERTAEIFFEKGDEDMSSVVEAILESLLKTPIDLRAEMASSILIIGGGGMLQGFIPRLRLELLAALKNSATLSLSTTDPFIIGSWRSGDDDLAKVTQTPPTLKLQARRAEVYLAKTMLASRFSKLRGLRHRIAILNDVSSGEIADDSASGSAPAWSAGLTGWVGGSIAGALQVSGQEITPPGAPKDGEGKNVDTARSTQPHRTRDRADHELSQAQRDDLQHQAERTAARRREIAAIPRSTHRVR